MKSIKRAKSEAVWLKSEGPYEICKNQIWLPIPPWTSPPHCLSLFILHWMCHSALKYSCQALKNKCICRKEQKLKREKLVVLQDTLSWWKWQRALSRDVASGNADDVTALCGSAVCARVPLHIRCVITYTRCVSVMCPMSAWSDARKSRVYRPVLDEAGAKKIKWMNEKNWVDQNNW